MSESQNGKRPLGRIIGQWYIEGQWFKSHSGHALYQHNILSSITGPLSLMTAPEG